MVKPEKKGPRPLALALPADAWTPDGSEDLRTAVREDLHEVLQFARLRLEKPDSAEAAIKLALDHNGPVIITFHDVPGLPLEALEGALAELQEMDLVVGPCPDGSVYLLGFAEGAPRELAASLISAAAESLEALTQTVTENELEPVTLPPWFRLRSAKDLSFAESLARLSLQSEDGDVDFLADRLKNWLTEQAKP